MKRRIHCSYLLYFYSLVFLVYFKHVISTSSTNTSRGNIGCLNHQLFVRLLWILNLLIHDYIFFHWDKRIFFVDVLIIIMIIIGCFIRHEVCNTWKLSTIILFVCVETNCANFCEWYLYTVFLTCFPSQYEYRKLLF
jgi:hypothetical protein